MKKSNSTYMPMAPLERLVHDKAGTPEADQVGDQVFADMCGVSTRAITRWRKAGGLIPWTTADHAATRMGLHPVLVWPIEWLAMDEDVIRREPKTMKAIDKAMVKIGEVMAEEAAKEMVAQAAATGEISDPSWFEYAADLVEKVDALLEHREDLVLAVAASEATS